MPKLFEKACISLQARECHLYAALGTLERSSLGGVSEGFTSRYGMLALVWSPKR